MLTYLIGAAAPLALLISIQPAALADVVPSEVCEEPNRFDPTSQKCSPCESIDERAVSVSLAPSDDTNSVSTTDLSRTCVCLAGLVECRSGEICFGCAANSSAGATCEEFVATKEIECRDCPEGSVPTEDRRRCLPCGPTTQGISDVLKDCKCPSSSALEEREPDGNYRKNKSCVKCATETFAGPQDAALMETAVYGCRPCPDPKRMSRNTEGECECKKGENGYAEEGGICVAIDAYDEINNRFPEASAAEVTFRDLIANRELFWERNPFGHYIGIELRGDNAFEALRMDFARSSTTKVTSAPMQWLYIRCAIQCTQGNATACQCISNLCVAALYDDGAVNCRFITESLYEGKIQVSSSAPGHKQGLPWLFYSQPAKVVLEDSSLDWQFTFAGESSGGKATSLFFWLARYSLEGAWLGWKRLDSELDLCMTIGGDSASPRNPAVSWRRFGSSVAIECKMSLLKLLECGFEPIFYDLFVENVDGSLLPVPVRILNLMTGDTRPNLNKDPEGVDSNVFVRRFSLCDALIGKQGSAKDYLTKSQPRVFRWAAHMAMEIKTRPDTDAMIYIPVLSIAYAEAETSMIGQQTSTSISFRAEYTMDTGSFWTTMIVFIILLSVFLVGLGAFRLRLVNGRYPALPPEPVGTDPGLFVPRIIVMLGIVFSTIFSGLFWFHFTIAMYWLIVFKLQDTPHRLLPAALDGGDQYRPHDVLMIIECFFLTFSVVFDLLKHLKVFVFLVDWEKTAPGREGEKPIRDHEMEQRQAALFQYGMDAGMGGMAPGMAPGMGQTMGYGGYPQQYPQPQYGGFPQQYPQPGQQMGTQYGAPNPAMMGYGGQQQGYGYGGQPQGYGYGGQPMQPQMYSGGQAQFDPPDRGISAWRSIFVINELNERLTATRTRSHVTWIVMLLLLEGCGWKNGPRWYPAFGAPDGTAIISARYNPILQFSLGTLVWLFVIICQLLLERILSIVFGNTLTDFVDVCSVANVSVLFLDEPFHGYYIHGKAPLTRGECCHSELAKNLNDEGIGAGVGRGLTNETSQVFEMFLPADFDVNIPAVGVVKFRPFLNKIYCDFLERQVHVNNKQPPKPNEEDLTAISLCRCKAQALVDAMVHEVIRRAGDIIRTRDRFQEFWGAPPPGGAAFNRQPIFYEDRDSVVWSACLAHGSELRLFGVGFPTGFEWHVICLELITFHFIWRFGGSSSLYWAAASAYLLNRIVICAYGVAGRTMIANSTIISSKFLI